MIFNKNTKFDVICLGRSNIDLYANEIGPLYKARSCSMYLGGSPANTAVALSKLGLSVGFIGRVSNDNIGQFIKGKFADFNVDTSNIFYDTKHRCQALTLAEIRDDGCDCFVYRDNCSDIFLSEDEITEEYIASSKCLLISGIALSQEPSRSATLKAIAIAKNKGVKVILDPDFRENSWPCLDEAKKVLSDVALKSSIVISTDDEFSLLKQNLQKDEAISFFKDNVEILVIKNGKEGSCAYTKEHDINCKSFVTRNIVKTFGAGDSFAAGFIYGLLNQKPLDVCQKIGSACASITIQGHSCSESSPTLLKVQSFLHEREVII